MKVIIAKDYEEMSKKAFEVMREVVKGNPRAVLGLATGSTPIGLYKNMIEDHKQNGTSYREIRTVNLDEYAGLDYSSDQRYVYFMRSNLFDYIDIDLKNTNIENGKAADRQAECDRYNRLLEDMQQDIQAVECAQGAMPAILVRPTRSRALRSSGWNTTMTAIIPISKTRFNSQSMAVMLSILTTR